MATIQEKNLQERIAAVEEIIQREKKIYELSVDGKTKMKRSVFCRRNGIDEGMFCRVLSKKSLPHLRVIKRIFKAFEAEGI